MKSLNKGKSIGREYCTPNLNIQDKEENITIVRDIWERHPQVKAKLEIFYATLNLDITRKSYKNPFERPIDKLEVKLVCGSERKS